MPPSLHKIYVCLTLLFHLGSTLLGNPKQGILSQFNTNDLELQNVRIEQTYKYICICTVFFIKLKNLETILLINTSCKETVRNKRLPILLTS